MTMQILTYLAVAALGLALIAVLASAWTLSRCGRHMYEHSLALQRLRSDVLDIQTDSTTSANTAGLSESVSRVASEVEELRVQMSQLADGLADTKAVVQRFGKEVNTTLQSKEVKELLHGQPQA